MKKIGNRKKNTQKTTNLQSILVNNNQNTEKMAILNYYN